MTKVQLLEACVVVLKDCEIRGSMVDEHGHTCAFGALGRAAGLTDVQLNSWTIQDMELRVQEKFSIPPRMRPAITSANDLHETREARQQAVVKVLESFYDNQI